MSPENHKKPRVGIPWRTREEERQGNVEKLNYYFDAVRLAGGEPEHVSLALTPEELGRQAERLDAFVLPGSPADVDPARYNEPRHALTRTLDGDRDRTDSALLDHALSTRKPVLAICYGCQILNVHQGGSLVQDIPSERPGSDAHGKTDLAAGASTKDLVHDATLADGSRLQQLAGGAVLVRINSSHHQSIDRPGKDLRVTARGGDGIIEGVELAAPRQWVVGVQWHPERMPDDAFAQNLFRDFIGAARQASLQPR
ncbi:MAG TPA: gamma-glutamyl-gamma-aminobutyrate hydrolase family protein [Dongiaceae bacterium]|nr:gamma-glutamyl-gamma-aminobutyrate hydrolase family protein [Dongiaceae bacterium]